jgi:hypothetical protein
MYISAIVHIYFCLFQNFETSDDPDKICQKYFQVYEQLPEQYALNFTLTQGYKLTGF